jgi:hypothetical protein
VQRRDRERALADSRRAEHHGRAGLVGQDHITKQGQLVLAGEAEIAAGQQRRRGSLHLLTRELAQLARQRLAHASRQRAPVAIEELHRLGSRHAPPERLLPGVALVALADVRRRREPFGRHEQQPRQPELDRRLVLGLGDRDRLAVRHVAVAVPDQPHIDLAPADDP